MKKLSITVYIFSRAKYLQNTKLKVIKYNVIEYADNLKCIKEQLEAEYGNTKN